MATVWKHIGTQNERQSWLSWSFIPFCSFQFRYGIISGCSGNTPAVHIAVEKYGLSVQPHAEPVPRDHVGVRCKMAVLSYWFYNTYVLGFLCDSSAFPFRFSAQALLPFAH
jgi:hypothetical protein